MADLKLLRIEDGDSQSNLTDKANYNFASLLAYGGGPYGRIGPIGPDGDGGSTGPVGSYGYFGGRGTIWTVGPCQPAISSSVPGDFWLNVENSNNVYQFGNGAWSLYGFNLKSQDLFSIEGPLTTSLGVSSRYGYFLSSNTPINYTVVISDNPAMGTLGTQALPNELANPQYSKFVISTNGTDPDRNILEFSKSAYSASPAFSASTPRFRWLVTGATADPLGIYGVYGLGLKSAGSLNISIPSADLELRSTSRFVYFNSVGFNFYINSPLPFTTNSTGNTVFDFGTGVARFSTKNISYSAGQFNISTTFNAYSGSTDSNPALSLLSYSPLAGNLRYLYNAASNSDAVLFRSSQSGATLFSVSGNGYVYMNKKVNSIQQEQTLAETLQSTYNGVPVNWTTISPSISATTSASNLFYVNSGSDYVIKKSPSATAGERGICLWTPATGGSFGNNGGWLNLVENGEAISFRVRSDDSQTATNHFKYLGLNTTNDPLGSPNLFTASYNSGIVLLPAASSSVEFTIVNITGTGGTSGTRRWYKVYYSAWGGGLTGPYCGVLTTCNATS
jgi:hypothetical protein